MKMFVTSFACIIFVTGLCLGWAQCASLLSFKGSAFVFHMSPLKQYVVFPKEIRFCHFYFGLLFYKEKVLRAVLIVPQIQPYILVCDSASQSRLQYGHRTHL